MRGLRWSRWLSVIRLIIEDGIPGAPASVVFQTPPSLAHVEDVGLGGNAEMATVRPPRKGDGAPAEILEHSGIVGLGGERERNEQEAELGEQNANQEKRLSRLTSIREVKVR